MQNEVIKAIHQRRTIRKYTDQPVPKDMVETLLESAVMAPSARNTQPWRFSVVQDLSAIKKLAQLSAEARVAMSKTGEIPAGQSAWEAFYYRAPLLIVISGKRGYEYLLDDINLAVENMFLAAQALGLGSCWLGRSRVLDQVVEARDLLGVTADLQIVAPLIFGYPDEEKSIPEREVHILKWLD